MTVSGLVILDKARFGWLVGTWFLPVIASGCFAGAAMMLAGILKRPERWTWRGVVLLAWALIALTSPAFGFLFLLPWSVLVLTLPLVVTVFVTLFRATAPPPTRPPAPPTPAAADR